MQADEAGFARTPVLMFGGDSAIDSRSAVLSDSNRPLKRDAATGKDEGCRRKSCPPEVPDDENIGISTAGNQLRCGYVKQ